ncbi:hypothetical protein RDABS01_035512, partial [Bienertia sinuspersici]
GFHLINHNTGQWDISFVRSIFGEDDCKRILVIPLSSKAHVDRLYWCLTPRGEYTVKSGYWLTKLGCNYSGHNQAMDEKVWSNIWIMEGPLKMKHFLWRACKGSLAVKERLHSRHICESAACTLCGETNGTITYAIFYCNNVKDIWEPVNTRQVMEAAPSSTFKEKWSWLREKLSTTDLWKVGAIAWACWMCRNKAMYEQGVSNKVLTAAGLGLAICRGSPNAWTLSPVGVVKVNTDAHVIEGVKTSLGVVIRDEVGSVKVMGVKHIEPTSVEIAEAATARFGVELAIRMNFENIILESDATSVVNAISANISELLLHT